MKGSVTFRNRALAAERLQRDLKFVIENPVAGAGVCPVGDDLFCWHGSVSIADTIYHFEATFEASKFSRPFQQLGSGV
jgi:hypothetical protein